MAARGIDNNFIARVVTLFETAGRARQYINLAGLRETPDISASLAGEEGYRWLPPGLRVGRNLNLEDGHTEWTSLLRSRILAHLYRIYIP